VAALILDRDSVSHGVKDRPELVVQRAAGKGRPEFVAHLFDHARSAIPSLRRGRTVRSTIVRALSIRHTLQRHVSALQIPCERGFGQ
jgi:hypothetical protein